MIVGSSSVCVLLSNYAAKWTQMPTIMRQGVGDMCLKAESTNLPPSKNGRIALCYVFSHEYPEYLNMAWLACDCRPATRARCDTYKRRTYVLGEEDRAFARSRYGRR